jgi:hypothetical protein
MAGPILLRGAKPSNIVAITRCFVPITGLSRPPRSELYAEVGVEASKTDQ